MIKKCMLTLELVFLGQSIDCKLYDRICGLHFDSVFLANLTLRHAREYWLLNLRERSLNIHENA